MIAVFIDSNSLFTRADLDFSKVWSHKRLDIYVEMIEAVDLYEHVKLVIPEMVFEELHRQQLESYKAKIDEIRELSFPSWTLEQGYDVQEYKEWLNAEHESFRCQKRRGMVSCEIAETPLDCLESIVRRAIEKRPPFEGGDKKSDKGFKDVLIWETLLGYKRNNLEDDIVLVTEDKLCKSEVLRNEYRRLFGEEIRFCAGQREFEDLLNDVIYDCDVDAKPLKEQNLDPIIEASFRLFALSNAYDIALINDLRLSENAHYQLLDIRIEPDSDTNYHATGLLLVFEGPDAQAIPLSMSLDMVGSNVRVAYENKDKGISITKDRPFSEVEELEF